MECFNKKCEECGNIFLTNQLPGMNKKYCSNQCYLKNKSGSKNGNWKGGKNEVKCPVCNKIFFTYQFKNSRSKKSCSKKCGNILKSINNKKTNLGKTKYATPHLMKMSIERSGKKRSKKICKNISKGTTNWLIKTNFKATYKFGGYRMRSKWERLFAKFLDLNNIKWKYEPKKFYLKQLNHYYLPDFYIPEWDTYVEVKGYMSEGALKKINAFKYEYGNLVVVGEKEIRGFGLI